ncbi:MAG: hypothetical protein KC486_23265 [Myxococcales bacterium]|nr:hypothetical protein [Myxococcales bacterium]
MTDRSGRSWWTQLKELRRARSDPARIGDAAAMQTRMLGRVMSPHVEAQVQALRRARGPQVLAPTIDFDALGQLPRGALGRELVEFCRVNAIAPAVISAEAREGVEELGAAARYICLHDLFHVLLGCDTSIPEELRITAFILEQRYFRGGRLWLGVLYLFGPLVRPWLALRTLANIRRGRALARRAPMLLGEPLEDWFAEPVEVVRARLGIA